MAFAASLLGPRHLWEVVENKPASSLVVFLGKALNGTPPLLYGRQVAQTPQKWQLPSECGCPVQNIAMRFAFSRMENKYEQYNTIQYKVQSIYSKLINKQLRKFLSLIRTLMHIKLFSVYHYYQKYIESYREAIFNKCLYFALCHSIWELLILTIKLCKNAFAILVGL